MTNIRSSELAALTHFQRSQYLNFGLFTSFPLGILKGDFSSLSLNILSCDTEHELNWFRNSSTGGSLGWNSVSGLIPTSWNSSSVQAGGKGWIAPPGSHGGGRKHMGTPGGARVCLQGSAVNEFGSYTKMWNLFSRFPRHQQHPGALEAEGQLPHSFPGVSLLKKESFCSVNLEMGAGMGWPGNPWNSECNWLLTELWPWLDD